MRIRSKIILVVLPLIITPLVLLGIASFYAARNGITGVATEFLAFKAEQLATYAQGQWDLLVANGLESDSTYREASEAAVETFRHAIIRGEDKEEVLRQAERLIRRI